MLLSSAKQPFADSGWLYQLKWDGVRNLTLAEGGRLRHWSRRLRERTELYPEFEGLGSALGPGRVVLDGEIVVMRAGKPSFAGVLERETASVRVNPQRLAAAPATLILFDLLELNGRQLYHHPLEERLGLLTELLEESDSWQVVSSFSGLEGPALYRSVQEAGLEGVVAKRLGSFYQVGCRTRDWIKIKQKHRMLAVVCGYTAPSGRSGALLLGAYRQDRLRYIGRVGSGIPPADLAVIRQHLDPSDRPFDYEPDLRDRFRGAAGPVIWTEPRLTVQVEFSRWTEDKRLRDPVLIGFSTEPPSAAVLTEET